jgi:type II secretory ATPase GspE/PulE/Tfp pilus assembly ATPase PilB-like protein
MGIEGFLLASTIEAVVAQRLARKICDKCRYSQEIPLTEIKKSITNTKGHFKTGNNTLYFGKGCSSCNHTGYNGRTALFEVIRISPTLKDALSTSLTSSEIWKIARNDGSRSMFEDGMDKVKAGVTTLEELKRVASQAEY